MGQEFGRRSTRGSTGPRTYDVVVLGAGLGGLLAAAFCAQAGARVLVVERLDWIGGRFATHWRDSFGLSSGALHFVPHGATGPLAQLIRELGLPELIAPARLFGSVLDGDRVVLLRRPADILRLVPVTGWPELLGELLELKRSGEYGGSFGAWLDQRGASHRVRQLWSTFADFALGLDLDQIHCREMRAVVRNVALLGDPGMIRGGCGGITRALAEFVRSSGGEIWTRTEVEKIQVSAGRSEVLVRDRRSGSQEGIGAGQVVSGIGPAETARLLGQASTPPRVARGLKIHMAAGRSLIPHSGIMFCLNTHRLSGVVQPTNADPSLAPRGQHLLIGFGTLRSDDLAEERRLALADVQKLFGQEVRVLACTVFADSRWPVNRALQGSDVRTGWDGVHLVGDGCKPPGFMMADGVARGVEIALQAIGVRPATPVTGKSFLGYIGRSLGLPAAASRQAHPHRK